MKWNYRIIAHNEDYETYFEIHEVHYDAGGNPKSYSENSATIGGNNIEDIKQVLEQMKQAFDNPILSADNFPNDWERQNKF